MMNRGYCVVLWDFIVIYRQKLCSVTECNCDIPRVVCSVMECDCDIPTALCSVMGCDFD